MSSDGQREKILHNYRESTVDDLVFSRSFFRLKRTRESTPANTNNSVLAKNPWRVEYFELNGIRLESLTATNNHQGGLGDSEDESDAKIILSLTLKLVSNQLHASSSNWCQGNHRKVKVTLRVLVENNFDRDNVSHMPIKVFCTIFTTAMCKCTTITLLDGSNFNAFQTFWPRLNILCLVDVPCYRWL